MIRHWVEGNVLGVLSGQGRERLFLFGSARAGLGSLCCPVIIGLVVATEQTELQHLFGIAVVWSSPRA